MTRGEVWWAELPKPIGRRPVLLLSRDEAYRVRAKVTVAPVTTRIRGMPAEVELDRHDGMPKPCAANLDSIATVRKSALVKRQTRLSLTRMREVERAIHFALGLES